MNRRSFLVRVLVMIGVGRALDLHVEHVNTTEPRPLGDGWYYEEFHLKLADIGNRPLFTTSDHFRPGILYRDWDARDGTFTIQWPDAPVERAVVRLD